MKALARGAAAGALLTWSLACAGGEAPDAEEAPSGPIDAELASRGQALFQSAGCQACHTVGGGRLVGPDLAEVTERRSYQFVMGMIVNPDSMLTNNETARALLAEYMTPMSNQGVTRDEARALYEYLRRHDRQTQ